MISIGAPQNDEEFAADYARRHDILRKPWGVIPHRRMRKVISKEADDA